MAATAIDKAIAARGPFRPDFQTSFDDLSRTARRALKRLPVEQRCVWAYRYLEAMAMPEVAGIIDRDVMTCWDLHDAASSTMRLAIAASPEPLCYKFVNL